MLPCDSCRHFHHARCGIYQAPSRFAEWRRIMQSGVCDAFSPAPGADDGAAPDICDRCERRAPDGRCGFHRGCDAPVKQAAARRSGECSHFSPLPPRRSYPADRVIPADRFITMRALLQDTMEVNARIGDDAFDAIIAVARSGLIPGSILATARHLPLWAIAPNESAPIYVGSGYRLGAARRTSPGPRCLIVDDTAASGGTMNAITARLQRTIDLRRSCTVAIYSTSHAVRQADIIGSIYEPPHYLEWNFANGALSSRMAFDCDGVICRDPECYDTDPEYDRFLRDAAPLYLPLRDPPVIISARCEWTRAQTVEWLMRHGVRPRRLILWSDDPAARWRTPETVAVWKADQLRTLWEADGLRFYVESDARQAAIIAERARLPVLCPSAETVFGHEYHVL